MILYIKISIKSSGKLLELTSEFSNVTAFEVKIQKIIVFLRASNKHLENKMTILLTIAFVKKHK